MVLEIVHAVLMFCFFLQNTQIYIEMAVWEEVRVRVCVELICQLFVSVKKNPQAWVHYREVSFSVMTQQQKQNHVTVGIKTSENILLCKCQSHCGSTSLQQMCNF